MNLIDREKCFTCGACVAICPKNAISMNLAEGFYYPLIDEKLCVNCGLCNKVCPALKPGIHNSGKHCLFAFKHSNVDIVKQSSSGAAFTALSDIILSRGGVIVGAVMGDSFKVYHTIACNKEERDCMRKSKYVQSDILSVYKKLADRIINKQWILFTGTPCQVDAFRSYCITKKLDLNRVVLCALLCHGSSSPIIWENFIRSYQKKNKIGLIEVNFRDKSCGWRNGRFTGKTAERAYDLIDYSRLYHSNLCNRKSCFSCPYTTVTREFDVTIGDFWSIQNYDPNYLDDQGVSMLLSHSQKGELLIRECTVFGRLKEYHLNLDNHQLARVLEEPYDKPIEYELFWDDYKRKNINYVIKKYVGMSFYDRLTRWIRRKILYVGFLRRDR